MSRFLPLVWIFASGLSAMACQPTTFEDEGETLVEEGDWSDGDSSDSSDSNDSGGSEPVFNCDPDADSPCPEGQKCTVLLNGPAPVYECVPSDTALLPNEACTPSPSDGQDECPDGFVCLGPTPDSPTGACLELCTSDSACETAYCTSPPPYPALDVCAAICDPLAPVCQSQHICRRIRQSSFVCEYPLSTDVGTTADPCNPSADSGCAQGFVCEAGGIIPDCTSSSCCTALCDLSDADLCTSPMLCGEIALDPVPGLEDIGACYVPQ